MKFEQIKIKIKDFVEQELYTLEPWILNSEWNEKLPKLNELREKVKSKGLWLSTDSQRIWGFGFNKC